MAPSPGGPPLPGLFGQELARKLKAQPGDKLRLISPQIGLDTLQGADPSQAAAPRSQEFRLAGVFSSGFDEYDRRLVLTGLRPAQQLVGQGDVVTGLELRTQSVEQARQTGGEVISLLGGAPYRSLDWEELNHNLFTALAMQKAVLSLVLFLIILVAAFNIVASLTMMVIDKTREVAILKAMGMSSASVSSLFRVAGMAIGSLGVSLGLSLGVLTCKLIERLGYLLDAHVYMIERLPTKVSGLELVITGSVTILISLLATVYPSVRAARLHPVDGLRYD
ncbi:MAG: FtsX-like permease family protein [Polyangia bacterium]